MSLRTDDPRVRPTDPPGPADVAAAAARLAGRVHRTPTLTCSAIDAIVGRRVLLKCENLQRIGAFKIRGATNAIMRLDEDVLRRGVVTHSSGNHAQAVALAARDRGIRADIVMPRGAPAIKRAAVESYGGMVHACEPTDADRTRVADSIVDRTGATLLPPFDHPDVIAGQGTAARELLDDAEEAGVQLDAIVAPVGGGGLIAGTCLAVMEHAARAARAARPIRVWGGEPAAADDAARSLATGERQPAVERPRTIADGLLTGIGRLTWPIVREHVERIVTVSDEQIVEAMLLLMERAKLVVEPSGAVSLAALLTPQLRAEAGRREGPRTVGVVISGGNVDLRDPPWLRVSPGS